MKEGGGGGLVGGIGRRFSPCTAAADLVGKSGKDDHIVIIFKVSNTPRMQYIDLYDSYFRRALSMCRPSLFPLSVANL